MALSLETQNLVWQKAKVSLDALEAKAPVREAIRKLKDYIMATKGNITLQFVAIDASTADDASGSVLADVACRLYAVVGIKPNTGTDAYLAILDDATDDTGVATDVRAVLPFLEAKDNVVAIFPKGLTMGTGVVAKAYTDWDGTTDSTAGDAPNGFAIIGAA